MKTIFFALCGCLLLTFSLNVFAECGGGGCGGYGGYEQRVCDPYESDCQCSDMLCHKSGWTNCISRSFCCQAFGNIGAR